MFTSKPTVRVRAVVLAALAACSACGGGGGSPPASPPPPPVSPPPSPPSSTITAVATTSAASVDEGQPFRLDASGSTTTSGAGLSYAWTQTGGPAVTIANAATAVLDLTAPELTANAIATFRVTVTSGANSSQASVDVNLANIAQTPVHTTLALGHTEVLPDPIANLIGFYNEAMIGVYSPTSPERVRYAYATMTAEGDIKIDTTQYTASHLPSMWHYSLAPPYPFGDYYPNSFPSTPSLKYSVLQEDLNYIWVHHMPYLGGTASLKSVERPCAISWKNEVAYIGQRKRGFTALSMPLFATVPGSVVTTVNSGKSFCALFTPFRPVRGAQTFPGVRPDLEEVVALDTDTNTIYHYAPPTQSASSYMLQGTAQLNLNTTDNLSLVAQVEVGDYFGGGAGLALIFTDGKHRGVHRLVVIGLDPQREIAQETYSWPVGVPAAVLHEDLDRDGIPEIAIITSTSPQAVVFEAHAATDGIVSEYLPLSAPSFVEIGLGATTAVTSLQRVFDVDALYVGYRDRKEVRALLLPDN